MSLPRAIDYAHSAASDFFQNLIIAKEPIGVGSINFSEHLLERLFDLRMAAVAADADGNKTVQAKTTTDARCRPTIWTSARFILQMERNRSRGTTHQRLAIIGHA